MNRLTIVKCSKNKLENNYLKTTNLNLITKLPLKILAFLFKFEDFLFIYNKKLNRKMLKKTLPVAIAGFCMILDSTYAVQLDCVEEKDKDGCCGCGGNDVNIDLTFGVNVKQAAAAVVA